MFTCFYHLLKKECLGIFKETYDNVLPQKCFPQNQGRRRNYWARANHSAYFYGNDQVDFTIIAKKSLLSRYQSKMSLQFDVEEFIRLLVSALYESSDEDMEVDTASTSVVILDDDEDSDLEMLACNREVTCYPFTPHN